MIGTAQQWDRLATWGMGEVCLGSESSVRRQVVLKMLRPAPAAEVS
jgi:hypothetical protein